MSRISTTILAALISLVGYLIMDLLLTKLQMLETMHDLFLVFCIVFPVLVYDYYDELFN